MYESFYGLRELPFELTPNTQYLFLTPRQHEALSNLEYGLFSAKPITLLIGEAGTGKTTLMRAALESERCRKVRSVYINNPALTTDDFVRTLAGKFGLTGDAVTSKAALIEALEATLSERRAKGEITALIVDIIPKRIMATTFGVIAAGSAVGGIFMNELVSWMVKDFSYTPVFFVMALMHPIGIALLWQFRKSESQA